VFFHKKEEKNLAQKQKTTTKMSFSLDTVKDFTVRLINGYAQFIAPIALFIVFNSTVDSHTRDAEKLSLLWMKFNQSSEATRANMFPATAPGAGAAGSPGGDDEEGADEGDL
jgi:hypothetical protein